MRTLQAKIRRRWPWGLAASPLVLAGLIAVPVATHASAGVNGPFTVTNAATGKCLDSNTSAASTDIPLMNPIYLGGDPDMGAVYAKSCNGGNYQNWTITITSSDPVNTVVTITDSQTGKCLDSNASADNPGDPDMGAVYAKSCNGGGYQQWTEQQANILGGPFTFVNVATGKCLDSNASADNPGDPDMGAVYAKSCNGGGYQQWGVAHS